MHKLSSVYAVPVYGIACFYRLHVNYCSESLRFRITCNFIAEEIVTKVTNAISIY